MSDTFTAHVRKTTSESTWVKEDERGIVHTVIFEPEQAVEPITMFFDEDPELKAGDRVEFTFKKVERVPSVLAAPDPETTPEWFGEGDGGIKSVPHEPEDLPPAA